MTTERTQWGTSGLHLPRGWTSAACGIAFFVQACTGTLTDEAIDAPVPEASPRPQTAGTDGGATGTGGSSGASGEGHLSQAPQRVGLHRLNNLEYHNTIIDLLGVDDTPAATFITDEKAAGFDNNAGALGMTDARYEQYFSAADRLVERAFADGLLRARILTCTPSPAEQHMCAEEIILGFGRRAYRRPLSDAQVVRLLGLFEATLALGQDFETAIKQVAKAMLASASFLYRVELDGAEAGADPQRLDAFDLASRLSYLLWSTMPDGELMGTAESGDLLRDEVLTQQVSRMLADTRAQRFVEGFAGQWLGLRDLRAHQVNPDIYPAFRNELREAMVQEGLLYFDGFLRGDHRMDRFFTTDVNYVDSQLAALYGWPDGSYEQSQPRTRDDDHRRGFMGLSSFLTASSFSYRTAPTLRGKWVLENLLCTEIPPPPATVPVLDDVGADPEALQSQNVRVRLAAHRSDPSCAACHVVLDPIGFGLERFDAIGGYRERYNNGDVVDASGELPDGSVFSGLEELSELLDADPRFVDCVAEKLLTYALGRALGPEDGLAHEWIVERWRAQGLGMRALLEVIVTSDLFRTQRAEGQP